MKKGIVSMLLFSIATCYAQVPNITIRKENNYFYVHGQDIGNLNYIITNNENTPVWLWFSKEDISSLNNFQRIKQYFFIPKGDGSYYQWMCDGNVGSFTASLFVAFGKVIQPKESFYISFIHQNMDESSMVSIIDAHLSIISEEELLKLCPGVDDKLVKSKFTFHPSVITIPWGNFVEAL